MNPSEEYILKKREPFKSILIHLRVLILDHHSKMGEKISYGIPFFYYDKKPLCYLNILKGQKFVDLAFMRGMRLAKEFPEMKDFNNRKQVRSLQFYSLNEVDESLIKRVLSRAIEMIESGDTAWYD